MSEYKTAIVLINEHKVACSTVFGERYKVLYDYTRCHIEIQDPMLYLLMVGMSLECMIKQNLLLQEVPVAGENLYCLFFTNN